MISLRPEITCVNCWWRFPPEDVLWVSEHQDLLGDPVVGESAPLRFLPSRFDSRGNAIDLRGMTARDIACPRCHLTLPRALLRRAPTFVSILGTPSCGKSYFLASLVGTLRRELPEKFRLAFTDADSTANLPVITYEENLFHHPHPNEPVTLGNLIKKTQLAGELYQSVAMGGQPVSLPKPFSFLLEPIDGHQNYGQPNALQLVCLYDNAGEHFLPGGDSSASPGTRHMAESSFLMFLYDPTQDSRWLSMMQKAGATNGEAPHGHMRRQEDVLREAAGRVRKYCGLADEQRHNRPLIVVLSKLDLWRWILPSGTVRSPFLSAGGLVGLNSKYIQEQSGQLRQLLLSVLPELVYAAEGFCSEVYYLAASALGAAPERREDGKYYIEPRNIAPDGVTVPFLLGMRLTTPGIIPASVAKSGHETGAPTKAAGNR